jgi:phage terminase large subunit
MKYTEKQKEAMKLLTGPARNVMLYGGARAGKTAVELNFMIKRRIKYPGSHGCILRFRKVDLLESIFYNLFPKVLRWNYPEHWSNPKFCNMKADKSYTRADFYNGSTITFGGIDDRKGFGKILGNEYSDVLIDEVSEVPYDAWEHISPRLSEKTPCPKKIMLSQNPTSKFHWSYQTFIEHMIPGSSTKPLKDPDNWLFLQMTPRDNIENLSQDYIEKTFTDASDAYRKRFLEGEFGEYTELGVYTDLVIDAQEEGRVGVVKAREGYPVIAAADCGWDDPNAVWICQFLPNAILFLGYMEAIHTPFTVFIEKIWEEGYTFEDMYLPHDAYSRRDYNSGRSLYDAVNEMGNSPSLIKEKQFYTHYIPRTTRVYPQIDTVQRLFPKFWFNRMTCSYGLDCLKVYEEKNNKKKFAKHAADALRYAVMAYHSYPTENLKVRRNPNLLYVSDLYNRRKRGGIIMHKDYMGI